MKRTSITVYVFPLFCAFVLLALPHAVTHQMRSLSFSCAGFVTSIVPSHDMQLPATTTQKFQSFFASKIAYEEQLKLRAERTLKEHNIPQALFGRVIFRPMGSYMNFVWLDVGFQDNPSQGQPIIAKNSPVISPEGLVGIIEAVGPSTSICRLITDPQLVVAVRAARGKIEDEYCRSQLHGIKKYIQDKKPFTSSDDEAHCLSLLDTIEKGFELKRNECFAKGEICGLHEPYVRGLHIVLRGTGFNYEFADQYGDKRPLRAPKDPVTAPLLQTGDILITNGLDALFPEGIPVAKVTSIASLEEGAISYELSCEPTTPLLSELAAVLVLPPKDPLVPISSMRFGESES